MIKRIGKNVHWKIKIFIKNLYWDLWEKKKISQISFNAKREGEDTCYIISRNDCAGLFSHVEMCLRYVCYAQNNKMIPIIDMTNCPSAYVKSGEEKTVNWWDLYFEQPFQGNYSETDFDKKVKCCYEDSCGVPYGRLAVLTKKSRWYWGKVYNTYFKLNKKSLDYCTKEYSKLFNENDNVLGVKVRGTDYKYFKGHSSQPTVSEVISYVKKIEKRYDKIYLATEEYENVERFKKAFPGKVYVSEGKYYDGIDMSDKNIATIHFDRENDEYLGGLEYLVTIYILSKCNGLVGGINGGSIAAVYWNGGNYKDLKLIYKGMNE